VARRRDEGWPALGQLEAHDRPLGRALFHCRTSTSSKPAFSNMDCVPWKAFRRGHLAARRTPPDRPRVSGRPRSRAYAMAPCSSARATPWPRAFDPTTKHTIDHTGFVVDAREHLRGLEPLIRLAWTDADPAHCLAGAIGDQSRRRLGGGEHPQTFAVRLGRRIRPREPSRPEVHAPTPLRVAALHEELAQILGSGPS
jgi:hypothetical protein